jgi:hypothetical protein
MPTPVDVNVPMTQVYGHVLRVDDPLLGDNPKAAAIRAAHSGTDLKQIINDALEKFFFPKVKTDSEADFESPESPDSPEPEAEPKTDESALLVSLFKMIVDALCSKIKKV